MKIHILITLLLPSCMLGKVPQEDLKYALEHPNRSCLTFSKKHVSFVDRNKKIKRLKLSSIQRKRKSLYKKVQALRKQERISERICVLADQMTQRRLRREQLSQQRKARTFCCRTKPRSQKRISFSPAPDKVHLYNGSQPVDPTVNVDEWTIVDDWGREAPSGVRVYNNNRMSMDLDETPLE